MVGTRRRRAIIEVLLAPGDAIVGDRAEVLRRLAEMRARLEPELLVFDAGDYSAAYIDDVAALAAESGGKR